MALICVGKVNTTWKGASRVNTLFQLSLSKMLSILNLSFFIVPGMLCVFVTGNYIVNSYLLPESAHMEYGIKESTVEKKITFRSSSPKLKYNQTIEDVAHIYGLDSALLYAVISVESRYDPKAISKKGASGLMQLMPNIARHYGVVDMLDPIQNLHGGAQYLRDMLILFNNDISLAVAAYNAGETAVVRYGNRIPPYHETMNYVPRVLNLYQEYQANPPRPPNTKNVKTWLREGMSNGAQI
jgi:soluble lytic murein transglycosylase-like protein